MKKILVVDDSDVNLYLVQTLFEDSPDITIFIENDSTKTIDDIKKYNPDLLLLDLMMPNTDGFTLLHEIKADPGFASLRIIIVSAFLNNENIKKIKDYGVIDYIQKPIHLDEAEKKIKTALEIY